VLAAAPTLLFMILEQELKKRANKSSRRRLELVERVVKLSRFPNLMPARGRNSVVASTISMMEIGVFLQLANTATWVNVSVEVFATAW
jgi:hypothetical protein